MPSDQQREMFRRHAVERMQLSIKQAEDWVAFYQTYGPAESVTQWENTLLYRISLLKAAQDHEPAGTSEPTP